MNMRLFWAVFVVMFQVFSAWAQSKSEGPPSVDYQLLDLEAQIEALKAEMLQTRALANQERPSSFNPALSIVGDVLGRYRFGDEEAPKWFNALYVRHAEIEFMASVDPDADGALVLALDQEKLGDFHLHVEEAYATLKKWPGLDYAPLNMLIKVGKFRTSIGRMNRIHLHHAPQVTMPLALVTFLGDEGMAGQGLSLNFFAPLPGRNALNFWLEGVMGGALPEPWNEPGAEKSMAGIAHAWFHSEVSDDHFLDVGASGYLGRRGDEGSGLQTLLGADLHYSFFKRGYGDQPFLLLGNEWYAANLPEPQRYWPFGTFLWGQFLLTPNFFLGARYDLAPQEKDLEKMRHAIGGYLSYYTTEFLRFRLGYEHHMESLNTLNGDHRLFLSMVYVFGSHPIEPYFINR